MRLLSQVTDPILSPLVELKLPLDSIYHHVDFEGQQIAPEPSSFIFKETRRPLSIQIENELQQFEGNPRRVAGAFMSIIRDYFKDNRKAKMLRNLAAVDKDHPTPIVFTYGLIAQLYRYPHTPATLYYKERNLLATIFKNIGKVAQETNRQHYVTVGAPTTIPSLQQLTSASEGLNSNTFKIFNNPNAILLLELWKWFTPKRESSIFESIPKDKLHLVNILFLESGMWSVLNLGVLNSFCKDSFQVDSPENGYVIKAKNGISGIQLNKRLVRLQMGLMEVRTLTAKSDIPQDDQTLDDGAIVEAISDEMEQIDPDTGEVLSEASETPLEFEEPYKEALTQAVNTVAPLASADELGLTDDLDPQEFARMVQEEDNRLDEDLTQLNEIAKSIESKEQVNSPSLDAILSSTNIPTPDAGVLKYCDKLAADGMLSAAEYRRFTKLANSYKEIRAVDGSTLNEFMSITPEMLTVDRQTQMPDASTVFDKTMLKSSLNSFDSKYISEVLHRDYANTVMSMQNAGVAVTGYKVEKVDDILGGYEFHTVKLSPVVGKASTLRFKVPIIDKDGSFTSGATRYVIRKQKSDVPIRKTHENKVALTSYYGKIFITRGRKNTDNYGYWLKTKVMAKVLDKEDTHISNPVFDNASDPTVKMTRSYTAISTVLRSCEVNGFTIYFNIKDANELIPGTRYRDGKAVIGVNKEGVHLRIDNQGNLYKDQEFIGLLEYFLEIPTKTAPVEYITAGIFGKDIPVGVMLGLEMGLSSLMNTLNVKPRRVPAGEKPYIQPEEYALAFSDETLVFPKDNKTASIILSGFNEYEKALKLFSVQSFDKRGVYVNLLETNGIGVRYVREIDLANSMFVDPITRDILVEMHEPTTFEGLLFRSAQMLLTDDHPDELDPAYMRIKGYERVAGAIYAEMIQSLRVHNSALGKQNAQITMNPYSVWKRVSEDPAKIQSSQINPIASLKEVEAVTYSGVGGRSSVSMTKLTRSYHQNDMGTISEATKDSGDVGINIYTSADPQFTSLRGMSDRFDLQNPNPTSLLSTSALLAPGSDTDD